MKETEYKFGVKNYKPVFFHALPQLTSVQKELLNSLVGLKLNSIYVVWSIEYNEAWFDAPIVILFENKTVEVCCQKTNEISITTNGVNLKDQLSWYGDKRFEWREFESFDSSFIITDIEMVELTNEISNVTGKSDSTFKFWDLGGLKLISGEKEVTIYNGFDTNVLSFDTSNEIGMRTIKFR